jgi:hypothetical protein
MALDKSKLKNDLDPILVKSAYDAYLAAENLGEKMLQDLLKNSKIPETLEQAKQEQVRVEKEKEKIRMEKSKIFADTFKKELSESFSNIIDSYVKTADIKITISDIFKLAIPVQYDGGAAILQSFIAESEKFDKQPKNGLLN